MQTKVILKKDVYGLGEEGDVKKVKAGYARNYLFPYSYAVIYNSSNLQKLESQKEEIDTRKQVKIDASKSLFDKINGLQIIFEENISEKGKLFGSIKQNDIFQALKERDLSIEKRNIQLAKPIRDIGETQVNISFYGNLIAKVKVLVKEKNAIVEDSIKNEDKVVELDKAEEIEKDITEDTPNKEVSTDSQKEATE